MRTATILLTVVAVLAMSGQAMGGIARTWSGAAGADWDTVGNWTPSTGTLSATDTKSVLTGTPIAAGAVLIDDDGSVTVSNADTIVTYGSSGLEVGINRTLPSLSGRGTLLINSEAQVTGSGDMHIGKFGGRGDVTVTGDGSSLHCGSIAYLGNAACDDGGTNTLDILANADVTFGQLYLRRGNNAMTVDGDGSTLSVSGTCYIGQYNGTVSTLDITDGGVVNMGKIAVANYDGSSGAVTISGTESTLTSSGADAWLLVGKGGTGTMDILAGGTVTAMDCFISGTGAQTEDFAGTGTVTVSGAGSTLTCNSELAVGNKGDGVLTISDGGVVSVIGWRTYIGSRYYTGGEGSGIITVTGTGSILNSGHDLRVGSSSTTGTLVVTDNGEVNVAAQFRIYGNNSTLKCVIADDVGGGFTVIEVDNVDVRENSFLDMDGKDNAMPGEWYALLTSTVTVGSGSKTNLVLDAADDASLHGGVGWEIKWEDSASSTLSARYVALDGDANVDGDVGLADFNTLKNNYGSGTTWRDGDFDDNSDVGLSDFNILKNNYGASAPGAIPEPATLTLLGLGGLALIRRRRK